MEISKAIAQLINDPLQNMGYGVVRVKLMEGKKRNTLQIMLERVDGRNITVDDCADASHTISAILDVEDPIKSEYNLEVSSPGIDRPLTRPKDFLAYANNEIKFSTVLPIDGRKHFRGMLEGIENDDIRVFIPEIKERINIPFDSIASAKLVLTDKLLKEAEGK